MLLRVRVNLPDRPGSLGRVAVAMGYAGADIVGMIILERANGRAVDDFIVSWPSGRAVSALSDELSGLDGARVVSVWHVAEVPGYSTDFDVLTRLPTEGPGALVDAVPGLLSADWAVLARQGVVIEAGRRVPDPYEPPLLPGPPPLAFTAPSGVRYAAVPLQDMVLLAARTAAPPFHAAEVDRLARLAAVATAMLTGRLTETPAPTPAPV